MSYGKTRDNEGRAILVEESGQLAGMPSRMDACLAGRLFTVANQTPTDVSATLVEAYTGLAVGNPAASGKYLVFHEFGYANTAEIADEGILALAVGTIGSLVAVNIPVNCLIGGPANSVAVADETGPTLGTLSMNRIITGYDDGASALSLAGFPVQIYDFKGSLTLMPGYAIVTDMLSAPGAVMQFHFMWEEVDI